MLWGQQAKHYEVIKNYSSPTSRFSKKGLLKRNETLKSFAAWRRTHEGIIFLGKRKHWLIPWQLKLIDMAVDLSYDHERFKLSI